MLKLQLVSGGDFNFQSLLQTIAYSYYYQYKEVQYDQTTGRRMLNIAPEYATQDNYLYMDCSSYVNSIYYLAFGIHITPQTTQTTTNTKSFMEFAKNNQSHIEVIDYTLTENYQTAEEKQIKLQNLKNNLQIGDLVVYRYDNSSKGHVMIYMGNDLFLHATGASYDYDNGLEKVEQNGAVLELSSSAIFDNTSSSRYLFKSEINEFCILRPLNRAGLSYLPSALQRYRLNGLSVEKIANVSNYSTVQLGQEIEFTIILKNNTNNPITDIKVYEKLPTAASTIFSSNNGVLIGDELVYTIDRIEGNEELSLVYIITLTDDEDFVGEILESDEARVENIDLNPLYFTITDISEVRRSELKTDLLQTVNSTYSDILDVIQTVYYPFFNDVSKYTSLKQIYESSYGVPYLYGGYLLDKSASFNQDRRTRMIYSDYLSLGDIIFLYDGTEYNIYIFLEDNILTWDNNTNKMKSLASVTSTLSSINQTNEYQIIRFNLN